jgi:coenzyme PQQ precursor peptide PqqA
LDWLRIFSTSDRLRKVEGKAVQVSPGARSEKNANNKLLNMSESIDHQENAAKTWETPIFQEIPISFEASSYALTEDDPPHR